MVIRKTRKKYAYRKRKRRKTKKYIGGNNDKDIIKKQSDEAKKKFEKIPKNISKKEKKEMYKRIFNDFINKTWGDFKESLEEINEKYEDTGITSGAIDSISTKAKKNAARTGAFFKMLIVGAFAMIPYAVAGVGAGILGILRKTIGAGLVKVAKKAGVDFKDNEFEELKKTMDDIKKDIKNGMGKAELRKKYLDVAGTLLQSLRAKSQAQKKSVSGKRARVLEPYINAQFKFSKEGENKKLENKSGPLFYKVSINKNGFLKFNTAGPMRQTKYNVTNLFDNSKFISWGGKRRTQRRKRRKRKTKKKRRK